MATVALAFAQLAKECEPEGLSEKNAERIANELAKAFNVLRDEVAILKIDKPWLQFVYPLKLRNVGNIPLNNVASVAARTANTKRAEAINNFAQTKHASIFEAVDVSTHAKQEAGRKTDRQQNIIQKLLSVPVVSPTGVLGVIQVCRKGISAPAAGTDFVPADLQKLVQIAASLAKCFK